VTETATPAMSKQIGHLASLWPLVVVKEPVDNAFDAAERVGVAPEITVVLVRGDPDGLLRLDDSALAEIMGRHGTFATRGGGMTESTRQKPIAIAWVRDGQIGQLTIGGELWASVE
jgi:hypothetical protein